MKRMNDLLKVVDGEGQVVEDQEQDDFEERFDLMMQKVRSLIDDWKVRDLPKGRGLEVTVKTVKDNFKDTWVEKYQYSDEITVFFVAEIGTKKDE